MDGKPQAVCVTVDTEGERRTCRDQNLSSRSQHIAGKNGRPCLPPSDAGHIDRFHCSNHQLRARWNGEVECGVHRTGARLPRTRGTPRQQNDNGEGQ